MIDADVSAAATANFVVHATYASSRRSEARVCAGRDLVVVDSGLEVDTFNIGCAARLDGERAVAEAIRTVENGFEGRPFSWWVAPGDEPGDLGSRLEAAGLVASESELAMAARLDEQRLGKVPVPSGLRLERVSGAGQLDSFARLLSENWNPPEPAVETFFRRSADDLLGPDSPQRFYLAFQEGDARASAGVELTVGGGTVGVYNLSTRVEYRRRGIASALMARVLGDVLSSGGSGAILQATELGAGLYRRLGFETFGVVTEHKPARRSES